MREWSVMFGDAKAAAGAVAGLLLGLAVGAIVVALYGWFWALPGARSDGRTAERIEWQERQRQAEVKANDDLAKAQEKINRIAADNLQLTSAREAQHEAEMSALEQALEDAKNVPIPVPGAACRPVIPGGVSRSLDNIGRATPRTNPR